MLFRAQRAEKFADVLVPQLPLALISGFVLLIASVVPLEKMPIVPCAFKRFVGLPCLFCGMTRAFSNIGHGHIRDGVVESPVGALLYSAVVAVFLISLIGLIGRRKIGFAFPPWLTGRRVAWSAAALLLANWIYRMKAGLD